MSIKRTCLATFVISAALAVMVLAPATAGAVDLTTTQCLVCHGTDGTPGDQVFDVGSVDKNTACRACHVDSLAGSHPYHNGGGNCGAICHSGWGNSLVANLPNAVYSYGAFSSPSSQDTTAGLLHVIHSQPRWMSTLKTADEDCGRCHAAASCEACHNGSPAPTNQHAHHGDVAYGFIATTTPIVPWVGNMATGAAKLTAASSSCGAATCHDIAGIGDTAPGLMDNFTHAAYPQYGMLATTITKIGTWTTRYGSAYTGGQEVISNFANAALEISFTGERVVLVSDRDPYRGVAEVFIDNVSQGTVDLFNGVTRNQDPVWTSNTLSAGSHTLKIRVTGAKNPSARGAYVSVDQFKVYVVSPGSIAPKCSSCHPAQAFNEGADHYGPPIVLAFSHEATQVATQSWDTGYGTFTCDQCHVMLGNSALRTEHGRASTHFNTGVTNSCGVCHAAYSTPANDYATTTGYPTGYWDPPNGCSYSDPTRSACHVAPRDRHGAVASIHATLTTGASATCASCHPGDLRGIHANSVPGNGYLETNGCLACHGANKYPNTKDCTSASCHVGTGITSVATHGFDVTKHTAQTFTRAFQDSAELDDGGFECSDCHTARLDTAHAEAPAVGCATGGASGNGCHEDTAYDSKAVAAGTWVPEKCVTCHDYSAKVSHDDTLTPHLVTSNGCAGSGSSCHNSNDLWALHDKAQNGGVRKYGGCTSVNTTGTADAYVCHVTSAKDDRPTPAPIADSCGSTSGACHQELSVATHPGAYEHPFSTASYYVDASETGCTNRAGCHNTGGSSTADMGMTYHPNSSCPDCHTNPSYGTDPAPDDCQTCHDGSYSGAIARTVLTAAPGAGGHYNEATHTASGMTASLNATSGAAAATCIQCHPADKGGTANYLANQHTQISVSGSPYGAALSCGECHADTRAKGNAEVVASWTNNTCADCHATGTSSKLDHATLIPPVYEVTSSCGSTGINCHTSTDLHVLHKNATSAQGGCNLTGCHDFNLQANVPSAKSCGTTGACHTAYTSTSHTHALAGGDAAKHQPTTSTQASSTTYFSTQCGLCHDIRNSNSSLTLEHASAYSTKTTDASNNCRNCHNNAASGTAITDNWSAKDTTSACSVCHTGGLAIHSTENTSAHTVSTSTGCGGTGIGCHNTTDLSKVGVTNVVNTNIHSACLRCHDRTASGGNVAYNPNNKTCGSGRNCHATAGQYNTTTYVHNGTGGLADGNDGTHHTAAAAQMSATITSGSATAACSVCHSGTLERSHATTLATDALGSGNGAWTNTCTGCHNENRAPVSNSAAEVKAGWSTDYCSDCHATYHDTIGTANHTGTSTQGCANSGINCHPTDNLVTLHAKQAGGCAFTGCHTATYKDSRPPVANKTCGSGGACHTTYTSAQAFTHANSQETTDHAPSAGNTVQANAAWAVGGGSYTCTQCHIVTKADGGLMSAEHSSANSTKTVDPTNTCKNCHNSAASTAAITGGWALQKDTTAACAQCHTGGLAIHATENTTAHTTSNSGCSSSGIGCHNTDDLSSVGTTATAANSVVHNTCMRCHDRLGATSWSNAMIGSGTNVKYDPGVKTCGGSSGCHTSTYYTATAHRATSNNINGLDALHIDSAMTATIGVGPKASCGDCHSGQLANAHKETSTTAGLNNTATGWDDTAQTQCRDCHNSAISSNVAPTQVKGHWSSNDCGDCHVAGASSTKIPNLHSRFNGTNHVGVPSGGLAATCGTSGCHDTKELAVLHEGTTNGCATAQCHDSKDKQMMGGAVGCGAGSACHNDAKYSAPHGGNHNADMGIVTDNGTNYVLGMNEGCFGCHYTDLTLEHGDDSVSGAAAAGRTMQKDTGNYPASGNDRCGACHTDQSGTGGTGGDGKFDEGTNSWVQAALSSSKTGGRRCDACHKGNGTTGPRVMHSGGTVPNTPVYTGNAPAEFLNYPQGGGHGAVAAMTTPYSKAGSVVYKSGTNNKLTSSWAYKGTWPGTLPSYVDAGSTFGTSMVVKCEYCHQWTSANYPSGPQGAAGIVTTKNNGIAYSAATYADRASTICADCHPTASGKHGSHGSTKCTMCHIAIPHAWKRHGLLRRTQYGTLTVVVSDGGSGAMTNGTYTFTADVAPYIQAGTETGIVAFSPAAFSGTWDGGNCETGGCRSSHAPAGSLTAATVWP